MPQISVVRPWAYFGFVRPLNIYIDGENVGSIRVRKSVFFTVSPGSHLVTVSMDWCKSKPYSIEVAGNCWRTFLNSH